MDPITLMAIASIAAPLISGAFGDKGGKQTMLSGGQQGLLDQIINQIKGQGGGGGMDIGQNQNFQQGQEYLNSLFNDPDFFNKFEAPMQRQFEENMGDIGNRFAGMGSGGSTGSTGFRNVAAREASNLSSNMGAMRGGMQQQGANQALQYGQQPFQNLMQLMGFGMQPKYGAYQQSSY